MALQNALSRLRNNEEHLQASNQHKRRPENDKAEQVVAQVGNVFSLEQAERDIFDIDNDIFSNADILFSSDGEHNGWCGDHMEAVALKEPSAKPFGCPVASALHSLPNSNSRTPENERSPKVNEGRQTKTVFSSPSASSLEKLKSFTFTKQAAQQHKGRSDGKGSRAGFEPPTKKRSLSTSPVTEISPTGDANLKENGLFDPELLAAFVSDPDETVTPSHSLPHHSLHASSGCGANYRQTVSQSGTVDTPFRKPISHPRRSTDLSSNKARSTFPIRSQDASTNLHTPRGKNPSVRVHQEQQLNTVDSGAISQTLMLSSAITPSTPQHYLQPSATSIPTIHGTIPTSASSCSSTRISSSATHPLPPSSFSTPQRISAPTRVRRKFPGPAGILPTLTAGQSLEGIVIPTPSLPTPSSTPRVKTLLATPLRLLTTNSQSDTLGASGDGDPLDFSQGPWVTMLQDLDMDDVYSAPLLKCTIARAIKQASRQQLRNGKVTHLRVLLKSIVPACRNASAVLKDPTGEILCTIHQSVMEEHRLELQPGAVIILRLVTFFSPAPRKHYLSITPDNIVIIYPSPTATATVTRKTICLTEVEKRFRDLASTKENSPHNLPRTQQALQPSLASGAELRDQQLTSTRGMQQCEYGISSSQRSSEAAPTLSQDHQTHRDTPEPSYQRTHSIFSNQLCEDEFDSIMGVIGSGLDF